MASSIYLFSYECNISKKKTARCIADKIASLYDVKKIHGSLYLIKSTDDVELLEKFLSSCFTEKDTYILVDITDQKHRYKNIQSKGLFLWMDNI